MPADISPEQSEFIEEMGVFGVETGAPRSLTRVLGYLLICEPVHQTAANIQSELELSTGSVHNALSLLQDSDLVRKRTFPGDRRYYYEMVPEEFKRLVVRRLEAVYKGVEIAEKGLRVSPRNPRLTAMRDVYAAYTHEVQAIIKRLDSQA